MHESTQASALIEGLTLVSLIGDKGYDNDGFRVQLAEAEIDAVRPYLGLAREIHVVVETTLTAHEPRVFEALDALSDAEFFH